VHLTCLINITYLLNLLKYIAGVKCEKHITTITRAMEHPITKYNTTHSWVHTQLLLEPLLQLLVYSHLTGLFHQILLQVRPRHQNVSRGESLGYRYCRKRMFYRLDALPVTRPTSKHHFTLHQTHFTDFHQKALSNWLCCWQVMKASK